MLNGRFCSPSALPFFGNNAIYLNNINGIDSTGNLDSTPIIKQILLNNPYKTVYFDGSYKISDELQLATGQVIVVLPNSNFKVHGIPMDGNKAIFRMANYSHLFADHSTLFEHVPIAGGNYLYQAVRAIDVHHWTVNGIKAENMTHGMYVSGSGAGANQYLNGSINFCEFSKIKWNNQNPIYSGMGLLLKDGCQYVETNFTNITECQNYAFVNLEVGNTPINNCRFIGNYGGLKVTGSGGNDSHFGVKGCQINHNEQGGFFNMLFEGVSKGVSVSATSIYGGVPFSIQDSLGITMNGCDWGGASGNVNNSTLRITGGSYLGNFANFVKNGNGVITDVNLSSII